MARSRIKTIAKLFFLLGLPLLVLGGIFGGGVYCGATHQRGVLEFETAVLGMEPGTEGKTEGETEGETEAEEAEPKKKKKKKTPPVEEPETEADEPESKPEPEVYVVPMPYVVPIEVQGGDDVEPEPDDSPPVAEAAAVPGDLRRSFNDKRVVTVKLLVDRTIVERRADWVDYVQELVEAASATYEVSFGIELRLHGVVEWEIDRKVKAADDLLADVRARPREGADLLLAITDKPMSNGESGRGDLPATDSPQNGAYAVVFAHGRKHPHLRTMLHEIGHMFGAVDVEDPTSEAYQKGSWMSYAASADGAVPWIDETNRRTIIERKSLPFVVAGVPRGEGEG